MSAEKPFNPSGYDMPHPTSFLILDDLSNGSKEICQYLFQLSQLIDSKNKAILVDTATLALRLKHRYERKVKNGEISPIQFAFTIGDAGEKVANSLGLNIPRIKIYPTRVNAKNGELVVVSKVAKSLAAEIESKIERASQKLLNIEHLGLIDDTVFNGETLKVVTQELRKFFPSQNITPLALTYVPHLAKEQLANKNLTVVSGLALRSSKERQDGINSIDAKDFVDETALPLSNGSSLPFMYEENWMRAWFGDNYESAMNICQQLAKLYKSNQS